MIGPGRIKITRCAEKMCMLSALGIAMAISSPAQTIIHRFNGTNGANPWAPPVEGLDTYLYGTTESGGKHLKGTVYKLSPTGAAAGLYSFCAKTGCPDGASPMAGLVAGADGYLHGVTWSGGAFQLGESFAFSPTGKMISLSSFCGELDCGDGAQPQNTQVAAIDGWYWGTATDGGNNGNYGVIYQQEVANNGQRNILYDFCNAPGCADGYFPRGPLVQASDGKVYGTTSAGGLYG